MGENGGNVACNGAKAPKAAPGPGTWGQMLKMIDWPPIWLSLSLLVVSALDRLVPWGLFGPMGPPVGGVLVLAGLALMGLAAGQMLLRRTTLIPRRDPSALVTGGVFRLSRNPIYLGDALILAGAILWWDVPHGVPVLIGFMALIQHRFILEEEARLHSTFGGQFEDWAARTGRWIGWSRGATGQL